MACVRRTAGSTNANLQRLTPRFSGGLAEGKDVRWNLLLADWFETHRAWLPPQINDLCTPRGLTTTQPRPPLAPCWAFCAAPDNPSLQPMRLNS